MSLHFKNHKVIKKVDNFEELLFWLYTKKSIYFAPAGKIMPTAFFNGWAWRRSGALEKHIKAGSFYQVQSRDEYMRDEIRKQLSNCPKIVVRMSNGAQMIQL